MMNSKPLVPSWMANHLPKCNRKKVIDLNTGRKYDSIREALEDTGLSSSVMNGMLYEKEGREQYGKYKFRFL